MKDIQLFYKNKKNLNVEINKDNNQYIYLEPLASIVVRYIIKNLGVEEGAKLANEVKENEVVSVKFIEPKSTLLSKKSDFDDIVDRGDPTLTLDLNFNDDFTYILDALYTNKLNEKVKVKVRAYDIADEIIENEFSYIDAPDGFIRTVGVVIDSTGIEYTFLYRRSGRVVKYTNKSTYSQFALLVKDVLFLENNYYTKVPRPSYSFMAEPKPQSIIDELIIRGWTITPSSIYRVNIDTRKQVQITDEELGDIIKDKLTVFDLVSLLTPTDLTNNGHRFINEGENFLTPCDAMCSLMQVTPKTVTDQRGY